MKQKTKSDKADRTTEAAQTPVFPKTMHSVRTLGKKSRVTAKTAKRENTFSKSRDTREDRGERQQKTSTNAQTLSRGR